ncbi:uncharacterized protein PRCAT00000129001 [Priceomyces carsonii]|uniref:uncharacterized protein n=1 Tax=Priceomyces carsonii TaxID=28549 RepID=UPI002ED9D25E|nr:unnamed protein product [Priceomyces carsonii]
MPVKAIQKLSVGRNGVGAYVVPCHKIALQYCNWGGSSSGARDFLSSGALNELALKKRNIVFEIKKVLGHPKLKFYYANKNFKEIEVKNFNSKEIKEKLEELSQSSGNKLSKFNQRVLSINESVRGVWSPLHVPKDHRHRI